MVKNIAFFLFFIFTCCFDTAISQSLKTNPSDNVDLKMAVATYTKSLGEQSGVYQGSAYIGYPYEVSNGHQFFESAELFKGSIFYNGMFYRDIPMWYDIVKDQVVVQSLNGLSKISLHKELVEHFTLYGHHFIKISEEESRKQSISAGFYDNIYAGKTPVFVRRYKSTLEDVSPEGIYTKMLKQKNDIYIQVKGDFHVISNAGSVLKALNSKQKEILAELKKNHVKFKKDAEKATIMMVSYYDQLSN